MKLQKEKKTGDDLENYFVKNDSVYPSSAFRMTFITNHDENSWNGTVMERMGKTGLTFAMLSYTLPGMPLIYSGQEVGLNKRLEFFEKDKINWDYSSPLIKFYAELNNLKKENEALWNGDFGGSYIRINTSGDEKVYAFFREKNENKVLVVAFIKILFNSQKYIRFLVQHNNGYLSLCKVNISLLIINPLRGNALYL